MTDFTPGWYVLQTARSREKRAEAALMELGFDAYFPRETRWISHGGQRSRAHYPFFPGYLFAHVVGGHLGFHAIRQVRDVQRAIAGTGGEPRPISQGWVGAMREAEAGGKFDRTQKAVREKFKPGAVVQFEAGGFAGLLAKVIRSEPGDRVRVLFEIFGAEREVTVSNGEVAAA